ncbi:Mor transcription activator family protein [Butyrivibrio sp.]|uniref:Mor transcription activator family protein n=1 Tax=Butyrivibrio sp. TaxID=28121 RepID=UPI0025B94CCC|nr:Mor transcription activator family protein [Butyrivibrio sp.]
MIWEIRQCKFHMKITGQTASDIFKKDSVQLNIVVSEEEKEVKSNPEKYSGVYKELAEILGDAATMKVWRRFAGLNITFPQKLYSADYRKDFIKENMDEMRPAELARILGLTERRIRQIIIEIKNER